jgi:hypothetical protein
MTPRCWRCRRVLTFEVDRVGRVVEDCPHCRGYIARLLAWIAKHKEQRNRWNRTNYAKHREAERARIARWTREHAEVVKQRKRRYHERIKLGLHTPKRRKVA